MAPRLQKDVTESECNEDSCLPRLSDFSAAPPLDLRGLGKHVHRANLPDGAAVHSLDVASERRGL
jgi:hypothetical protein